MTAPSESTGPRRRWFVFSLRTLLVLVTVLGVGLGWLALQLNTIHERRAALAKLPTGSYIVRYSDFGPGHAGPQLSLSAQARGWLGDEPIEFFWIPGRDFDRVTPSLKLLFPEADFAEGDYGDQRDREINEGGS